MAILPGDTRVVVTLNSTSNVPQDAAVNVWHFSGVTDPADLDTIVNGLIDFYDGWDQILASTVKRDADAHTVTAYDLNDPEPRPPLGVQPFTLGSSPTSSQNLPAEVACCLSFASETVAGANMKRRRGRVYLGPFNDAYSGNEDDEPARPASIYTALIIDAAETFLSDVWAIGSGVYPAIFSRADNTLYSINRGWVDNAFDTQRRRGVESTSRSVFTVGP